MNDDSFQVDDTKEANPLTSLSCSRALRELDYEIELFTPALFMVAGHFDRDPAKEYNALIPEERPKSARPFCLDLQQKHSFFKGLGKTDSTRYLRETDWDRRLYCINKDYASECLSFIRNIAIVDPRTGYSAGAFSYRMPIVDPTDIQQFIFITTFGIVSDSFIAYIDTNAKHAFYRHLKINCKEDASNFFLALSQRFSGVHMGAGGSNHV